ncbi:transposase [mine drainage metagenome]|uniref:Transposase n=1 Tax=mine drainage metagenome TaxID=410659 RepID=T0XYY3_9ZZZZ
MKQFAKQIADAQDKGLTPYAACVPAYSACGNRLPRLNDVQQGFLLEAVADFQRRTPPISVPSAWSSLDKQCKAAEINAPSITTFRKALRAEDPTRRALSTGGMRAYQAAAPRSDPRLRSGKAYGFMHTMHIDSSKRDVRASPNLKRLIDQRRAVKDETGRGTHDTFYVAIDEATGLPVGHAFVIGPSRIEALAILIREVVHRQGVLPRVILEDRGPENQSHWLQDFCLHHGITLIDTPTSGSRFNGQAENLIKQVNARVSQRLPGSTLPDKAGRSVDSKFKSLATAKLEFLQLCELIEAFLYEDVPHIPLPEGETPQQLRDAALDALGMLGISTQFDNAFLFETSAR